MKKITVAIIIASDKGYTGNREDLCIPTIKEILDDHYEITHSVIVPDEISAITKELINLSDNNVDIIFTSGGTGLAKRDITPEATLQVIDRNVPGISEAMRYESMKFTNRAMLSRGISGIRQQTLIINLPGSPKAVIECINIILPVLPHAIETLKGTQVDCARRD